MNTINLVFRRFKVNFIFAQFIIFEIFSNPLNFAKLRYDCRIRTNVRDQTFRRNLTSNLFISRNKSRKNRAKGFRNFSRNLPQLTSKRAESEKLTRRRFNNRDKSMRCRKYRNLSTRNFSFFHHRSNSTPAFIRPTIDYNTREKSSAETS